MTKTIEEEMRTYAQMCSVDEDGYVAIEKAIQFGIDLHKSLPLSQRLTDEEKKRVRIAYNAMSEYGKSKSSECCSCANFAAKVWAERIFGKDFFRDPPAK